MCTEIALNKLLSSVYQQALDDFGCHLESVILYGSYARGDADEESDVDIMILVNLPTSQLASKRKNWSRFGTDLDLQYGVLTSFKLQDTQTFNEWRDILPYFKNILREGVKISA